MRKRFSDQCDAVRPVRPVCCAGRFRCIRPIFRWALWGLEIGGAGLLCALVRPFFWRKR